MRKETGLPRHITMKDDKTAQRLAEKNAKLVEGIKEAEASIKRIDTETRQRNERMVTVSEDIRTKAKLLNVPLKEKPKPDKKKDTPKEKDPEDKNEKEDEDKTKRNPDKA